MPKISTVEWWDGTRHWFIDGKRGRIDGPAVHGADPSTGTREWWLDGKRHRTDGPAIEWADGTREWYIDDKLHRTDGPAYEPANGTKEWWLDGKRLSKKEFDARTKSAPLADKVIEIDGVKYKLVVV